MICDWLNLAIRTVATSFKFDIFAEKKVAVYLWRETFISFCRNHDYVEENSVKLINAGRYVKRDRRLRMEFQVEP